MFSPHSAEKKTTSKALEQSNIGVVDKFHAGFAANAEHYINQLNLELISFYDDNLLESSSTTSAKYSLRTEQISLEKSPMLKEGAKMHLQTMILCIWRFNWLISLEPSIRDSFNLLKIVDKISKCERKIVAAASCPGLRQVLRKFLQKISLLLWGTFGNKDPAEINEDTMKNKWLSDLLREKLKQLAPAAETQIQQKKLQKKDINSMIKIMNKSVSNALKSDEPNKVETLQNIVNKMTKKLLGNSSDVAIIDDDGTKMEVKEWSNKFVLETLENIEKNSHAGNKGSEKMQNLFEKYESGKFHPQNLYSLKKALKKLGRNQTNSEMNKLIDKSKMLQKETLQFAEKSSKFNSERFLTLAQGKISTGESKPQKNSLNKSIYPPYTLDTLNDCILALAQIISPICDVESDVFIYLSSAKLEVRDLSLAFVKKDSTEGGKSTKSDEQRLEALEENFLFTAYRQIVCALKQNEKSVEKTQLNGLIERNKRIFVDIILRSKKFERELTERNLDKAIVI